jgi:hypothetical protein
LGHGRQSRKSVAKGNYFFFAGVKNLFNAGAKNFSSAVANNAVQNVFLKADLVFEIPWLGCIKLFVNGTNTDQIPTNSVIDLVITLVVIVLLAFGINFLISKRRRE